MHTRSEVCPLLIADGRLKCPNEHGYVFIHDGARPFLTEKILEDTYAAAVQTLLLQLWKPVFQSLIRLQDQAGLKYLRCLNIPDAPAVRCGKCKAIAIADFPGILALP